MKKIVNLFLIHIAIFSILYLCFSFCEANFNISEWDTDSRGGVVFIYLTLGSVATSIFLIENQNQKKYVKEN